MKWELQGFGTMKTTTLRMGLLVCTFLLVGCPSYDFSSSVERVFATPEEEELITIAEQTYPDRDEVLAAMSPYMPNVPLPEPDENLWWYKTFSGFLTPYAITEDAVNYHIGLIEDWKDDVEHHRNPHCLYADFLYRARIEHHDEFEYGAEILADVYVVGMYMRWDVLKDSLSGVRWTKNRSVLMSSDGTIIDIWGDGPWVDVDVIVK